MATSSVSFSTLIIAGLLVTAVPQSSHTAFPVSDTFSLPTADEGGDRRLHSLQAKYRSLAAQLSRLKPHQPYILVDTARNHLYVKRQDEIVLDAIASTGSGTILDKPGEGRDQWIFDTPRGEFFVQSKLTNPAWVKPDWAFIEEGLAVPKDPADRVEQGVLGEYALGFGKGYFIHGTLYTRLLGKNVTHGCIRLNDGDLKTVYQFARVGTPIIIF
jgi:L,D-transpeptidase ErfK/SrfK